VAGQTRPEKIRAAADPDFRAVGRRQDDVVPAIARARPDMTRAITCTTRAPRPGEKDGVDYHFFSAAEFFEAVQAGNSWSTRRFMATATAF
jgi:guanylate kinase